MSDPFASVSSVHLSRQFLRAMHDARSREAYRTRDPEAFAAVQQTRQAMDWLDLLRNLDSLHRGR